MRCAASRESSISPRPRSCCPHATAGQPGVCGSFTAVGHEVTGAGHNALGAWWWLIESGHVAPGQLTQELGSDILDLVVRRTANGPQVSMRQAQPITAADVDPRSLATPLGLQPPDLSSDPARVVSTGVPHLLVRARDHVAVDDARPDLNALLTQLHDADAQGCYLYALGGDGTAYARFFNPTAGLWEDPATGSAAGPLAWWVGGGRPGRLTVEQGHAMGRPSRLELTVADGAVHLSGGAALTAEGRIHTPDQTEEP